MTGENFKLRSERTDSMNRLDNPLLDRKRKRMLREAAVINLIHSKAAGTPIKLTEFSEVTKIRTSGDVRDFLSRMVKHGLIKRHDSDQVRRHFYTVNGDDKTVKTRRVRGGARKNAGRPKGSVNKPRASKGGPNLPPMVLENVPTNTKEYAVQFNLKEGDTVVIYAELGKMTTERIKTVVAALLDNLQ